jgi:hypothetical protein
MHQAFANASSADLTAQKRLHQETRLFWPVGVIRADWTSPASPAPTGHAIPAGRAFQVACASGDIVARV